MPNSRFSQREPWLDRLAGRAARRGSAASRGEISLLAGVGVVIWAFLTLTVLMSGPQALPLEQAQLAVGVGGGLVRNEPPGEAPAVADQPATPVASTNPAPTETPPPTASPKAASPTPVGAAGPPPSNAKTAPSTPAPTPRATATPTPPPTPSPAAPPVVEPPLPTFLATPIATPTAQPTSAPSSATPTAVPSGTVEVVGPNGTVLTGPRGGPLNTRGADLYNCNDFTSLEQLIAVFIGSGPTDPNHLDPQHTGSPCPPEDEQQSE